MVGAENKGQKEETGGTTKEAGGLRRGHSFGFFVWGTSESVEYLFFQQLRCP